MPGQYLAEDMLFIGEDEMNVDDDEVSTYGKKTSRGVVDVLRLQVDDLHRDLYIQSSASARAEGKMSVAYIYRIPSSHRVRQRA